VNPTELQTQVFGSSAVGPLRTLTISFNQTFEAKRREDPEAAAQTAPQVAEGPQPVPTDTAQAFPQDPFQLAPDTLGFDSLAADTALGPSTQAPGQKVTLLALRTTAITYDFEQADEQGDWLWGIQTSRLSNTISSDYLRGLNISMVHDLFEDLPGNPEEGVEPTRKFSPHLSQMNLGFTLDSQSLPFRLIRRLLGGEEAAAAPSVVQAPTEPGAMSAENPFAPTLSDEARIIPGGAAQPTTPAQPSGASRGGGPGRWRANLSLSLQRPREENRPSNQMLQGTLTFDPTEKWKVNWRTSYDVVDRSFNDHLVRLTRDLHRWAAHFDFRKTATGNWSFRFEVSLTDQQDLHFDYSQRSIQDRTGIRRY
jgi:hypothetical protein